MGWIVSQAMCCGSGSDKFSPFMPVCGIDTGHSAWPPSGISSGSLNSARVFVSDVPRVLAWKQECLLFTKGSGWILRWQGARLLPLQPTNIKHLLCNSQCPRPDFYAGSAGREARTKRKGGFRICFCNGSSFWSFVCAGRVQEWRGCHCFIQCCGRLMDLDNCSTTCKLLKREDWLKPQPSRHSPGLLTPCWSWAA